MRLCRAVGVLAFIMLPLFLMVGCTGSDVISTGNAEFLLDAPVVNPDDRFDFFSETQLSGLTIRPNDPDADASIGPLDIGVIFRADDTIIIDLRVGGSNDPTTLVLSEGSYRISLLSFSNTTLIRPRLRRHWATCEEARVFSYTTAIEFDDEDLLALGVGDFQVPRGGGVVSIGIDATAFVDAFISNREFGAPTGGAWECVDTDPEHGDPIPIIFDPEVFKAQADTYLKIESFSE